MIASIVLAAAGTAAAPGPAYELRWTRAPGAEACIDGHELAAAVDAWLGRAVFGPAGGRAVTIDGTIAPSAGGWRVAIAVRDPDGAARGARDTELGGVDCRALDESLVLILGLIVDPDGSGGEPAPVRVAPPAMAEPRWRFEAGLSGAGARGVLPGLAAGARLAIGVDPPGMWPIAIGAGWWAPDEAAVGTGRSVELARWQVGVAVSTPAWRAGRARLSVAGGGAVARIAARGLGFEHDREGLATMAVASLVGRGAIDLAGPVFATAELGAEVPLSRPAFAADDGAMVYRVAPVSVVAALGAGVRF